MGKKVIEVIEKEKLNAENASLVDSDMRLAEYKPSIKIAVDGQEYTACVRTFKTKSIGYNVSGKTYIDGKKCQMSINIIVVGTKPKPEEGGK